MKSISNIISIALIGVGVAGFVVSSRPLVKNKEADAPLNILGINRSPYGEVFAMAMQGPIDTYFHAMESKEHACEDPDHCQHEYAQSRQDLAIENHTAINDRMRHFIEELGKGLEERTNLRAASAGHKFYIRRGIEDKLRFAYNLDPAHYGNYNAYHFFLTEPQLGTRPELTPTAAKLAQDTITYCLSQRNDPRQALTAAAAAENVIELMFNDRQAHPQSPNFTTAQMRHVLQVTDQAIGLYSHLANEWTKRDQWKNLSELRLAEVKERLDFIVKIREGQEQAIRRLEGLHGDRSVSSRDANNSDSLAR
jgi:hypothetical protein